jgi:D-beta-D-heptose 7-phosphate kinase/D-beta-D-heptose 1-phosphate adenosyltransferase
MTLLESTKEAKQIPAVAREVYDVSGAGDTVVATLAVALANDISLSDACRLANTAAGIVVGKVGTATLSAEELEASFNHHTTVHTEQKVLTLPRAIDCLKEWRRQGLKVGFTNGCFDLLHLGHLHILQESAAACDKLIIGLNSDASVKRLKGDSRPIQNEETRAQVLAALGMVDVVIIFDEETPYNLISNLLPDVLVKGADYTIDRVVGADIVQAKGGEVLLVNLKEGHSTTKTVGKMVA